ncbi:MAG UNVERIFIED_CONTAM: twin-arginine translocation signal domain-containing protein [Planctomycetaceae bacterium]
MSASRRRFLQATTAASVMLLPHSLFGSRLLSGAPNQQSPPGPRPAQDPALKLLFPALAFPQPSSSTTPPAS